MSDLLLGIDVGYSRPLWPPRAPHSPTRPTAGSVGSV
jgi:hypothetical protein